MVLESTWTSSICLEIIQQFIGIPGKFRVYSLNGYICKVTKRAVMPNKRPKSGRLSLDQA